MNHLLNVDQIANIVDLSAFTIRRALRDGELTGTKLRGQWRIDPADLAIWIEAGRQTPGGNVRQARVTITPQPRTTLPAGGALQLLRDLEAS